MEKINTGLKNLAKLFKMLKPCEVENKGQTHKEDYSFLSPDPRVTCLHLSAFSCLPFPLSFPRCSVDPTHIYSEGSGTALTQHSASVTQLLIWRFGVALRLHCVAFACVQNPHYICVCVPQNRIARAVGGYQKFRQPLCKNGSSEAATSVINMRGCAIH